MSDEPSPGLIDATLTGAFPGWRQRAHPGAHAAGPFRAGSGSSRPWSAEMGSPGQVNYAATRRAWSAMGRGLDFSRELGLAPTITANVVAPGVLATDMTYAPLSRDRRKDSFAQIPLPATRRSTRFSPAAGSRSSLSDRRGLLQPAAVAGRSDGRPSAWVTDTRLVRRNHSARTARRQEAADHGP